MKADNQKIIDFTKEVQTFDKAHSRCFGTLAYR